MSYQSILAAFRAHLEEAIGAVDIEDVTRDPTLYRLVKVLSWVVEAEGDSSSSSSIDPAGIATGIDGAVDIDTIIARLVALEGTLGAATDSSSTNTVIGLLKALTTSTNPDTEIVEWEVIEDAGVNSEGDRIREVLINGDPTTWTNLSTSTILSSSNIPSYNNLRKISGGASVASKVVTPVIFDTDLVQATPFVLLASSTEDRELVALDFVMEREALLQLSIGNTIIGNYKSLRALEKEYSCPFLIPSGDEVVIEMTEQAANSRLVGTIYTRLVEA